MAEVGSVVPGEQAPTAATPSWKPLRTVEPEPWSLGVRFQEEPESLHRCTATGDLPMAEDAWISLVIRAGHLVPAHAGTVLQAKDEIIILAPAEQAAQLTQLFTTPRRDPPAAPHEVTPPP